jgi:hypothetical protein
VIVQELDNHMVEVAAINPSATMQAVDNPGLVEIALQVERKLKSTVECI